MISATSRAGGEFAGGGGGGGGGSGGAVAGMSSLS